MFIWHCVAVILSEPALELHSRAVPSEEAHHPVKGPNTGRNFGGRRKKYDYFLFILHGNSKLLSFKMNCIFLTKLGALSPREFWIGANNKKFMVQYLG